METTAKGAQGPFAHRNIFSLGWETLSTYLPHLPCPRTQQTTSSSWSPWPHLSHRRNELFGSTVDGFMKKTVGGKVRRGGATAPFHSALTLNCFSEEFKFLAGPATTDSSCITMDFKSKKEGIYINNLTPSHDFPLKLAWPLVYCESIFLFVL